MVDRDKEHYPLPDSEEGLAWRGIERVPSSLSGKAPIAQQIDNMHAARAESQAHNEREAVGDRARATIQRQEGESERRHDQEDREREMGERCR